MSECFTFLHLIRENKNKEEKMETQNILCLIENPLDFAWHFSQNREIYL